MRKRVPESDRTEIEGVLELISSSKRDIEVVAMSRLALSHGEMVCRNVDKVIKSLVH